MADIENAAFTYLVLKTLRRRRARRRRAQKLQLLQGRSEFGESHQLPQELRLDDRSFQRYYRLSRPQFDDLLSRIGARITRQDIHSIPAAKRLSICLRFLATGDSFKSIASSFRVSESTVSSIIPDVAAVIWNSLVGEFMAVPTTEEWRSIAVEFEERWSYPLCCGAVDGKHVRLKPPPDSEFFNHKGEHSLVLLAVVDARYRFRVIDVGGYGRMSDGGILANSAFGQALLEDTLQLPQDLNLPGADDRGLLPHVFVASEAFPVRKHMMRPFPGRGRRPLEERVFNHRLSHARQVVENAFGIWTSQWRMFLRRLEIHPEDAEKCVKATCLLHNFMRATAPEHVPGACEDGAHEEPLPGVGRIGSNNGSREALRVREAFKAYFNEEGAVSWQPIQ
ncbi:uncharacterized protein [Eucyclogobius newberryi]|uniref:uncharacterized protein n=1 Tax=Eucyclogobius newberryi TaxID=166745 RepID=UPI003B5C8C63